MLEFWQRLDRALPLAKAEDAENSPEDIAQMATLYGIYIGVPSTWGGGGRCRLSTMFDSETARQATLSHVLVHSLCIPGGRPVEISPRSLEERLRAEGVTYSSKRGVRNGGLDEQLEKSISSRFRLEEAADPPDLGGSI